MQRYIIIRVLQGVLTLVALSVIVFVLPRATGDPVLILAGWDSTEEQREVVREELGLDKGLPTQYWIFAKGVLRGDLGESFLRDRPVTEIIMDRLPATIKLALPAGFFAILIGVGIGILCAVKRNKASDVIGRITAMLGQSLPSFWVGIVLILLFSVMWQLFPAAGMGGPSHYVLPVVTLSWFLTAGIMRLTRSSMLEVLGSEYVAFARARGISETSVLLKHALRNAAIPIVTFSAVLMGFMLTGSVVVETVFAWPGLGRAAYESIVARDFPVIQGIVLFYGTIFIFFNLVADILYAWLDPRIRYQ